MENLGLSVLLICGLPKHNSLGVKPINTLLGVSSVRNIFSSIRPIAFKLGPANDALKQLVMAEMILSSNADSEAELPTSNISIS